MESKFDIAIRNGKPHFFRNAKLVKDFNWVDWIQLIESHPTKDKKDKSLKVFNRKKNSIEIRALQLRESCPEFAKDQLGWMRNKFNKNNITLIGFTGFGKESKSFSIHRDQMDVLYLQTLGSVTLSLWNTYQPIDPKIVTTSDMSSEEVDKEFYCFFRETLQPDQAVWIPRGTFHLIEPLETRLGFSFGVEGDPDPKSYI